MSSSALRIFILTFSYLRRSPTVMFQLLFCATSLMIDPNVLVSTRHVNKRRKNTNVEILANMFQKHHVSIFS